MKVANKTTKKKNSKEEKAIKPQEKVEESSEFIFVMPLVDKEAGEKQIYLKDSSCSPEDIEKKQIFSHSCNKKYTIEILLDKFQEYPLQIQVGKHSVQLYDNGLENVSCSCADFYEQELNYCEHVCAIERMLRYHSSVELSRNIHLLLFANKKISQYQTYLFFNTLKQQYVVVGKGHKEETLILLKDFDNLEHKEILLHNANELGVWISSTARRKLESEIDPNKMDSLNAFYYRKKQLTEEGIREKLDGLLRGITLFDYQKDVFIDSVAAKRAIIALPAGAGKTATSIAIYEHFFKQKPDFSMFVISPNTLKTQWAREIKRFTGKDSIVLNSQKEIKEWDNKGIAIINYQMMTRYINDLVGNSTGVKRIADLMIVDEMQMVKNSETKSWKAMKRLKSDFFLALSGTIIENRLDDLFNVMMIVDESALGPKWKFDRQFQKTLAATKYKITYGGIRNVDKLHEKIKHCVFTISQEELNKRLPSIEFKTIYSDLNEQQIEIEESYRNEADKLLRKGMEKPLRPHEKIMLNAYLLKARQACTALELLDKQIKTYYEPKVESLRQLIQQHCRGNNEKMLIFSEWTEMLGIIERMIKKEFPEMKHIIYSGDVPTKQRPQLVEQFKTDPDTKLFLSSDAGGTGLDGLQLVCNIVAHMEVPWNPAKIDQRNARLHRTLQTKPVTCYYLVSSTGTEHKMQFKVMEKREIRKAALSINRADEEVEIKASELKEILEGN
jgi:SNF2 family DNA or RNA helicase